MVVHMVEEIWLFIWRRRYGCSYGGGDMVVHMAEEIWLFIWWRRYGCSYGGGDMVVHMVEEIAQDTNSELQHWFDFTSMKESLSIHVIQA